MADKTHLVKILTLLTTVTDIHNMVGNHLGFEQVFHTYNCYILCTYKKTAVSNRYVQFINGCMQCRCIYIVVVVVVFVFLFSILRISFLFLLCDFTLICLFFFFFFPIITLLEEGGGGFFDSHVY